jgi:predicted RNase H-like HicB family nuclease
LVESNRSAPALLLFARVVLEIVRSSRSAPAGDEGEVGGCEPRSLRFRIAVGYAWRAVRPDAKKIARRDAGPAASRATCYASGMKKSFTAVVERDVETGFYVGFVPGVPGAHSQGETLDELNANLHEVVAMLFEDGQPDIEAEFVGTQLVEIG